jgi:hypothetical protein
VVASVRRNWRRHPVLVRPETVVPWHRRGWRHFWRWKSRTRLGRPRLSPEACTVIATKAADNLSWGSERIRGELLKLGIAVSKRSANLAQAACFRRYGFVAAIVVRLGTYLVWHILYGDLICRC